MKWLVLVDFIFLYFVQSCFKVQTNKLQNLHRKPVLTVQLFNVLVLEYWFGFRSSFICKLSSTIMHWPWICKQTNYKIHTTNWFWLFTYTLIVIRGQFTKTHWLEQTCQISGYFLIYKILVQSCFFLSWYI